MKNKFIKQPLEFRLIKASLRNIDPNLPSLFTVKLARLYIAIKTGNTKLWSTIKNEESKNFDLITKSFEDQKALDAVKNKLKNP